MPTYERLGRFKREYRKLTPEQKARFRVAVGKPLIVHPTAA